MREENEFRIVRIGCRPFESGSLLTEPSETGEAGDIPGTAKCTAQPAKVRHAGRLGVRIVVGVMAPLVLLLGMLMTPTPTYAQVAVGISVSFGPPALPIYAQPFCPGPGYIWTPGYWAWDPYYGYYWVPGTWVPAPFLGAMWTPGYWGWNGGRWFWYAGYWGPRVGYYGGINYGYGYMGYGYHGGYWNHDRFYYNRAVNNIRINNIRYYYNQRVENVSVTRVSYNGGPGGINARPTSAESAAARERRFGPVSQQERQRNFARNDPKQRASVNRGRPAIAATPRPGEFKGNHVVRATRAGAPYREPPREMRGGGNAEHRAPGHTERGPAVNAPRRSEPNVRMERSAPVRREPAPAMERRSAPRAERASQNQARAPEERRAAPARSHPAPERAVHPPHPERSEGGNGHQPGGRFR
jgi:WXXGXW repeat (2 copies)